MSGAASFFAELKRRNVLRAAAFYAASAWLLVQVATQVFPFFHFAEWVVRWIVMAAVIGFPFAMLFSWFYEWTPQGIQRESEVAPDASIGHQTGKKLDRWIIAVLSLAVVMLLADKFVLHKDTSAVIDKSIAVLPLVNESGDPNNAYFSDGLSEELIAALAQIGELKVIGRSSSFRFKGGHQDSKTIGEKLGVGTLLEGTVRKQGEHVRIVAELINAADGRELWSQTYDRELKDVFAVQSEIAQAVAGALKVRLLGGAAEARQESSTKSAEAHNAYLQGHFYLERHNGESYPKAISFFDEAIRLDPGYALAYADRAEAWSWVSDQTGNHTASEIAAARNAARSDAEKAIAINPMLAEAHAALGWVRYFVDWNFAGALAELRRADQLAPRSANIKYLLSNVLFYMGQIQEASAQIREAVELDPLVFSARDKLAQVLTAEGRLDEAEAQGRKAAELQPSASGSHRRQVIGAVLRNDGDTALREAELEPSSGLGLFELALARYAHSDHAAADAALAELIAKYRDFMAYQIAEVYAYRGETDSAFASLQRAYDTHDAGTLGMLIDPLLRGLHSDPRFNKLLVRLGLPVPAGSAP